jgi:hypothetical protein
MTSGSNRAISGDKSAGSEPIIALDIPSVLVREPRSTVDSPDV